MGAAQLQIYNIERDPFLLDRARSDFSEARMLNSAYARSYIGLGAVTIANIELISDENLIASELGIAEGLYLTAFTAQNQPESAYIAIKAANGLGELYLRARQKGIHSWAGQSTANRIELLN